MYRRNNEQIITLNANHEMMESWYVVTAIIVSLLCVVDSLTTWAYFVVMQESGKHLLHTALISNGILLLVNLIHVKLWGFPESNMKNVAVTLVLNTIVHMVCFGIFGMNVLQHPENTGMHAVYQLYRFYFHLKSGFAMALAPSLLIGGFVKLIAWFFNR